MSSAVLWSLLGVALVFAFGLAFLFSLARQNRPLPYSVGSFVGLQRPLLIWPPLLRERGDIFVGTSEVPQFIQFRMKRYKSRPSELRFRMRNSDVARPFFPKAVAALEAAGVSFEMELTKKLKRPRAAVVKLPVGDPLLPSAAAHLCRTSFEGSGLEEAEVQICLSHGAWEDVSLEAFEEFPPTRAARGEFSLAGVVLFPFHVWRRWRS